MVANRNILNCSTYFQVQHRVRISVSIMILVLVTVHTLLSPSLMRPTQFCEKVCV
jgi:hypothetical protein